MLFEGFLVNFHLKLQSLYSGFPVRFLLPRVTWLSRSPCKWNQASSLEIRYTRNVKFWRLTSSTAR